MKIDIRTQIEDIRRYSWLLIKAVIPGIELIKRIGSKHKKEYLRVVFLSNFLLEQINKLAHNGEIVGMKVNIVDRPMIIESV